ncbi:hypothetical protein FEV53_19465 [Palleronia caenipelagi]|uniref:Uncharacterized protein n=1 Tax=Palleronia caenipelagi TaxID=2489174 RepID=A0A547PJ69_9RHOB|nr:hypothetical protein FEV53_19465 [Palleronia caenipelagi]
MSSHLVLLSWTGVKYPAVRRQGRRSPRRRRLSLYPAQFVTRYFAFANLSRRDALCLKGIGHPVVRPTACYAVGRIHATRSIAGIEVT